MDEETKGRMLASLEDYSPRVVESKAKEEARRVLICMKDSLQHYLATTPIQCHGFEAGRMTSEESLKWLALQDDKLHLLSVMAAIRLDDKDDYVENILSIALLDTRGGANANKSVTSDDLLASSTWQEEASQHGNNWLPPPWTILALVVLGSNEFISLLRNPLYLRVIFVAFLLAKAL